MTEINNTNDAIRVLWREFGVVDGANQASQDARDTDAVESSPELEQMARDHANGRIGEDDLIAVCDDPGYSDELRAAAGYLLDNRDELERIDGGDVDGDVGTIYRDDVTRFIDANRDGMTYDVVAAADAAEILAVGESDDFMMPYAERQAAFAERMATLAPQDRALLLQEVLRQDPDAMEGWLNLGGFDAIAPAGTGRISQEAYDAVLGTLQTTAPGIEQFIGVNVAGSVDAYQAHAEGLNWRISRYAMDEEGLQNAIDEFVALQGEQWSEEYSTLRQQVIDEGALLLQILGSADVATMTPQQRADLLAQIVDEDNPQTQVAIVMALTEPGAVDTATLDSAMAFFADAGVADSSPALAQALAQTRLQHTGQQLAAGDPQAASAALSGLRASPYAEVLGLDRALFEQTIDLIDTTLVPGADVRRILEDEFRAAADALDAPARGAEPRASESLRMLAVGAATLGLDGDPRLQANDLFADTTTTLETLSGWTDLGVGSASVLVESGTITANGPILRGLSNPLLGRALGAVGLVFGVPELIQNIDDSDWAQTPLTAAGVGSAALATFAPAAWAAWAGPAGLALGAIAVFGTLALNQWRKVDASNEYMDDSSQEFLEHAGFAPDVANALTDQSANGHSPVPFLFAYGEHMGLDRAQTIAWLNGLDGSHLESIRDRAHEALDESGGELTTFEDGSDEGTLAFLADFRARADRGEYTADNGGMLRTSDNAQFVVAGSWDEFTALLEAKGLVTPTAPLPNDGAPMDLLTAAELSLEYFDAISSNGESITTWDLVRTRDDASADPQIRLAAEFLLTSRVSRHFLDVGAGRGNVDGHMERQDLEGALQTVATGSYLDELIDTAGGEGGRDGQADADDIGAAYMDPGLTDEQRAQIADDHAANEAAEQQELQRYS